jgi:hypothetical protein
MLFLETCIDCIPDLGTCSQANLSLKHGLSSLPLHWRLVREYTGYHFVDFVNGIGSHPIVAQEHNWRKLLSFSTFI